MLLTAYYDLLRASEFLQTNAKHILRYRDVKVVNKRAKKHILLRFVTNKHSKNMCTREIQQTNGKWCPVRVLSEYLERRGFRSGPLFINEDGEAIKRNKVSSLLKQCISFSGGDPSKYNMHSLRVGRATQLLAENCSDSVIQKAGRWHSDALKGYLRPATMTANIK